MKMQPNKNNKSLSEINAYCSDTSILLTTFTQLLGQFDLRYINSLFSKAKKRGVEGAKVFQTLFVLRFMDFNSIRQLMLSGLSKDMAHKKDVLYSFLNNPNIAWRRIMRLFSKQCLSLINRKALEEQTDEPRFLILDDSLLNKTGKTIELIGKVFDHCTHGYKLGMKILTLGYCDGKSFLPLDFSIHHEPGKKGNRGLKKKDINRQFTKEREEESFGFQRVKEVSIDKITVALQMIKRYQQKWLKVDYVLADSWFICERFIKGIQSINNKLYAIGLMKTNRMVTINGKKYKANKVPEIKRKHIHRSRNLKCSYITFVMTYKDIEMRGYWIKMNGQENWSLLISTDVNLTFTKAMKHYKNRWSIEVFFKDCKQNLALEACQSTDFDAHISTISIVYMNYMVLALKKRFQDYETLGILFRDFKAFMIKQTIMDKLWLLLIKLFDSVFTFMNIEWNVFITILINKRKEVEENLNKILNTLYALEQEDFGDLISET